VNVVNVVNVSGGSSTQKKMKSSIHIYIYGRYGNIHDIHLIHQPWFVPADITEPLGTSDHEQFEIHQTVYLLARTTNYEYNFLTPLSASPKLSGGLTLSTRGKAHSLQPRDIHKIPPNIHKL